MNLETVGLPKEERGENMGRMSVPNEISENISPNSQLEAWVLGL